MQSIGSSDDDAARLVSALRGGGKRARVAIYFSGQGCPACATVEAGLRPELLGSTGTVFKASVHENGDLADVYRVSQTPTMILLSPERELGRVTATTPDAFNRLLAGHRDV